MGTILLRRLIDQLPRVNLAKIPSALHRFLACLCLLTVSTQAFGSAQKDDGSTSTFVRVQFQNRVSVEIPGNWKCLTDGERAAVSAEAHERFAEAGLSASQIVSSLAANLISPEGKSVALMNVRLYSQGNGEVWEIREQARLRSLSASDLEALEREIRHSIKRSVDAVDESGAGVEWKGVRVVEVCGFAAVLVEYSRPSLQGGGRFQVRLLRVPLGVRSFTLTTSYLAGHQPDLKPVVERISQSVSIEPEPQDPPGADGTQADSRSSSAPLAIQTDTRAAESSPVATVALVAVLCMIASSVVGAIFGTIRRPQGERSKQIRWVRVSLAALLAIFIVCVPLVLVDGIGGEWRSSRESGLFVEVIDLKTGMPVQELQPPLTESDFSEARRVTRPIIRQEIQRAYAAIRGLPFDQPAQVQSSSINMQSDLFDGGDSVLLNRIVAESEGRRQRWIDQVRTNYIDEWTLQSVGRPQGMSREELIRNVCVRTGLDEPTVVSNLDASVRLARLLEFESRGLIPDRPAVPDMLGERLSYLAWDDWYQRQASLRFVPLSLLVVGLSALCAGVAFAIFR